MTSTPQTPPGREGGTPDAPRPPGFVPVPPRPRPEGPLDPPASRPVRVASGREAGETPDLPQIHTGRVDPRTAALALGAVGLLVVGSLWLAWAPIPLSMALMGLPLLVLLLWLMQRLWPHLRGRRRPWSGGRSGRGGLTTSRSLLGRGGRWAGGMRAAVASRAGRVRAASRSAASRVRNAVGRHRPGSRSASASGGQAAGRSGRTGWPRWAGRRPVQGASAGTGGTGGRTRTAPGGTGRPGSARGGAAGTGGGGRGRSPGRGWAGGGAAHMTASSPGGGKSGSRPGGRTGGTLLVTDGGSLGAPSKPGVTPPADPPTNPDPDRDDASDHDDRDDQQGGLPWWERLGYGLLDRAPAWRDALAAPLRTPTPADYDTGIDTAGGDEQLRDAIILAGTKDVRWPDPDKGVDQYDWPEEPPPAPPDTTSPHPSPHGDDQQEPEITRSTAMVNAAEFEHFFQDAVTPGQLAQAYGSASQDAYTKGLAKRAEAEQLRADARAAHNLPEAQARFNVSASKCEEDAERYLRLASYWKGKGEQQTNVA
jgi:hypothetical protein